MLVDRKRLEEQSLLHREDVNSLDFLLLSPVMAAWSSVAAAATGSEGSSAAAESPWKAFMPLIGVIIGGLLVLIWRDMPAARWKRAEYVRDAFQERYDSPGAKNASFLLYWADRHIPLWADDETNRWERVADREAALAILPYTVSPMVFTDPEFKNDKRRIALNDSFVDLIWRLEHVRVASRAANPADVGEIIRELGELLSGHPNAARLAPPGRLLPRAFRLMLGWRGMSRLIQFFDRYGYDVRVTDEDLRELKQAFGHLSWEDAAIEKLPSAVPKFPVHWQVRFIQRNERGTGKGSLLRFVKSVIEAISGAIDAAVERTQARYRR